MSKEEPQRPPEFWFAILVSSLRDGAYKSADRAQQRLREAGIDVSFERILSAQEKDADESA